MTKTRLEAFSDGVIAIIITIMVLELKVPHGTDWAALKPLVPVFLTYVLSFIYVGIYWNNHHHMLHAADRINGAAMWANLHLLFWLSLVPFVTGWMGENHFAHHPDRRSTARSCSCRGSHTRSWPGCWWPITGLVPPGPRPRPRHQGLGVADGYAAAIPLAFYMEWIAYVCYVAVALLWLVPDKRIEATVG